MSEPEARCERLDDLAEEFAQRYRRGECPTVTEYAARYAELADEIRDLFPTIAAVERLKIKKGSPRGGQASLGGIHLERLGEFRILREIGRGGMGIVFEAEQESLGRHVAIKVLPRHSLLHPDQLKRFDREARIAARLQHPNIVAVFGVGEHEGFHYIVMQLIRGVGLDKVVSQLAQSGKSGIVGLETQDFVAEPTVGRDALETESGYWESVARIGYQAAGALHYAHTEGTLHCDIKPANLLIDPTGFLWVADFGVAKAIHVDKVTSTGDVTGTLQYMAPERFQGQTDARSDVYSLGMTLYELLTLRSPYSDGDRQGLVRRILEEPPTPPRKLNPQIPHALETIVLKATARDPQHRYASAEALGDDLRRFLDGQPIEGRRATLLQRSWRWCRRNPITASLAAAVVVLTLLLVSLIPIVQGLATQASQDSMAPDISPPPVYMQPPDAPPGNREHRPPGLPPPYARPPREGDGRWPPPFAPRHLPPREGAGPPEFRPGGEPFPPPNGDPGRTGPRDRPPLRPDGAGLPLHPPGPRGEPPDDGQVPGRPR